MPKPSTTTAGKKVVQYDAADAGPCVERKAARRDDGTDRQRQPASDPRNQAARPSGQREHDQRQGQERRAGRSRRVALDLDQIHRHRNRTTPSAAYSSSVSALASVNGSRAKERERQHRVRRAAFDDARATRARRSRSRAPTARPGGRRRAAATRAVRRRCRPGRGRRAPHRASRSVAVRDGSRLSSMNLQRQRQHDECKWHVQKEHGAPAHVLDEPAAADRADRGGDRAESRPGADRAAALGLVERGADDREAPRDQERGPHALQRAAGDQHARGEVAMPQRIDAAVKKMTPKRNTRLRPN